jgi:hypothetical protein
MNTINQITIFHTFALVFYCCYFSSIRSFSRHHNLQSCHGSYLSFIQTSLDRRTSFNVECRQHPWLPSESKKPDSPVCKTGGVTPKKKKNNIRKMLRSWPKIWLFEPLLWWSIGDRRCEDLVETWPFYYSHAWFRGRMDHIWIVYFWPSDV